ncbi:hypothetical protein Tco_0807793 [Tanacetum coccineum]
MAALGGANQISRRVIDDLIEFSGETSVDGYMSFFKSQQIAKSRGFINRQREEANTARTLVGQLNALIVEMEALEDQGELFDTLMDLRDDREAARTKLQGLNELITQAEQEIEKKEAQIQAMNELVVVFEFKYALIWKALLSLREKAKKHIEYKIGNGEWIFVWHDKWCGIGPLSQFVTNRDIYDARFNNKASFADMIDNDKWKWHNEWKDVFPELISIPVPSCSIHKDKAIGESNSRLRVEKSRPEAFETMAELSSLYIGVLLRYFDVDLTFRKQVMNHLGQLLRNFRMKLRQTYILPNQDTLSKLDEVPAKYSAILKAEEWVNFVEYTTTKEYQVKSAAAKMVHYKSVYQHTMGRGRYAHVKQKMKETEDKIKEGALKVDHGTDAMTVVLASNERIALLQSQLDNERREHQEKELEIQNLSNKMSETEGMDSKLMNQLAAQGQQLQTISTKLTPSNIADTDHKLMSQLHFLIYIASVSGGH